MSMHPDKYGTCTACGEFVTRGRAPFQAEGALYANRPNGRFCPAADGEDHTLTPKQTFLGPRNYVVGLPVCVTVDDYGRVTIDVDLAEITDVVDNIEGELREHHEVDIKTMSDAAGRIGNCLTMTIHPTIA